MVTLSAAHSTRFGSLRVNSAESKDPVALSQGSCGFLDFARNDGSIRERPDAFGTIAAAVRSEDTAWVPSTLADNASSPRRPKPNPR